jgi:two-component system, response regulator YesN
LYKILVVDDEELERKVLVFTLQNSGLPVEIVGEAGNGRDAIEAAKRTIPDVIFMDIKMPGIDGLEATKHIKLLNPATEIIILTAYGKFSYSQQAIRAQATDYLLKPTHPQQLIEATSRALTRIESKRFQAGPTLDMAGFGEQVRLRNLPEAKAALIRLITVLKEQDLSPSPTRLNSFGFRLLVFAVQSLLDTGEDPARLSGLEAKFTTDLARLTSLETLEEWSNKLLEALLSVNSQQGKSREQQIVTKAMEHMVRNFATDLSLNKVAAQVHISPSYFSRIFTRNTGSSFTEYLTKLRMKEAKHRLTTSFDTIDQIALELGFCSNSYFTAVFKKHEGITPSEFRTKHQA